MKPIRVTENLTVFPEMVAAVEVRPPTLMMVHEWLTVVILPMGGDLVVGRFPCYPDYPPEAKATAEQWARDLRDRIVEAVEGRGKR